VKNRDWRETKRDEVFCVRKGQTRPARSLSGLAEVLHQHFPPPQQRQRLLCPWGGRLRARGYPRHTLRARGHCGHTLRSGDTPRHTLRARGHCRDTLRARGHPGHTFGGRGRLGHK